MMRKCPNCGNTIKNKEICPVCGKRIGVLESRANDRPQINKSVPKPKKISSQHNNKKPLKTENPENQQESRGNPNKSTSHSIGSITSSLLGILCIVGVMLIVVSGVLVPDNTTKVSQKPTMANNTSVMDSNQLNLQVKVIYNGHWKGSIGLNEDLTNYDETGSKTVEYGDFLENDTLSASIQKTESNNNELKVQFIKNGQILKEDSTKTPYGIVTIAI